MKTTHCHGLTPPYTLPLGNGQSGLLKILRKGFQYSTKRVGHMSPDEIIQRTTLELTTLTNLILRNSYHSDLEYITEQ